MLCNCVHVAVKMIVIYLFCLIKYLVIRLSLIIFHLFYSSVNWHTLFPTHIRLRTSLNSNKTASSLKPHFLYNRSLFNNKQVLRALQYVINIGRNVQGCCVLHLSVWVAFIYHSWVHLTLINEHTFPQKADRWQYILRIPELNESITWSVFKQTSTYYSRTLNAAPCDLVQRLCCLNVYFVLNNVN